MPVRRIGIEVGKSYSWTRGDDQIEVTALASPWAENRIAVLEAALREIAGGEISGHGEIVVRSDSMRIAHEALEK